MSAKNAAVYMETAQTLYEFYQMDNTDGDYKTYEFDHDLVSDADGKQAVIRPDGVITGGDLISPAAAETSDDIDVKAFEVFIGGERISVDAVTDLEVARGTSAYLKSSIVVNSAGTVSVVAGSDHTEFSTVRGADGGPPSIPIGSVEIGQVWYTSASSNLVTETEIKQSVEGGYKERFDYPMWNKVDNLGKGNMAETTGTTNAHIVLDSALPVIHGATATASATATKRVYCQSYAPIISLLNKTADWKEPTETVSTSSRQLHRTVVGSESFSLTAGSFLILLDDGISDYALKKRGDKLVFKYKQDIDATPYQVCQGRVAFDLSRPQDADVEATVTIAATAEAVNFDE